MVQADSDSARAEDKVIWEFLTASSWPHRRWVLEQHHELLTPATASLFARLALAYEARGKLDEARTIDMHLKWLRRCREVGVDAAFGEATEANVIALSPEMIELLERVKGVGLEHDEYAYREILAKCPRIDEQFKRASLDTRQYVLSAVARLRLLRFTATGVQEELDTVIESWNSILQAASGDISRMTSQFSTAAGNAYRLRYLQSHDPEDLNRSIQAAENALANSTDPDEKRGYEFNLQAVLIMRYEATGNLADKRKASGINSAPRR